MDDLLTSLLRHDADVFQDLAQRKRELARDLIAASFSMDRHDEPGAQDGLWLEPALFMTRPTVLRRLVGVLGLVLPHDIDRIAATEPGSLPIAAALALETGVPFVSLREEAEGFRIHGELHPGERVVLVEDVTLTGTRAAGAVAAIREIGGDLVEVRSVIDCSRGARALLAEQGADLEPLFALADLLADHEQGAR